MLTGYVLVVNLPFLMGRLLSYGFSPCLFLILSPQLDLFPLPLLLLHLLVEHLQDLLMVDPSIRFYLNHLHAHSLFLFRLWLAH